MSLSVSSSYTMSDDDATVCGQPMEKYLRIKLRLADFHPMILRLSRHDLLRAECKLKPTFNQRVVGSIPTALTNKNN
jgi:hypothetical protein